MTYQGQIQVASADLEKKDKTITLSPPILDLNNEAVQGYFVL